jgi:predicted flap endonuclease-1-like 5' DNA nuclease
MMPSYTITSVEGIGESFATKLRSAGIRSVAALLKKGATRQGRQELAERSGVDETLILKWVNMADLYRVKGVGSEYAELLEKAGVDTVKELRNRVPKNLYDKMVEVNSQGRGLVRQLPSLGMVEKWVAEAKTLDPVVTY